MNVKGMSNGELASMKCSSRRNCNTGVFPSPYAFNRPQ